MKRRLLLILALTALGGAALAAPEKKSGKVYFPQLADLGNVMYVGDSITHGVAAASYRWPLFKIWVDNGIAQKEVGVHAKNHSGGVQPNSVYGEATFRNVHSAMSSERAYEIAGRINQSGRLENSNIFDWLGLDKEYSGKRTINPAAEMPTCFFMMIGTNDTLSDSGNAGIHSCIDEKEKDLLGKKGDMSTIVSAMREGNPKAHIAVTTIPTWAPGRHNNAAPEDFAAIERYNEKLKAWGRANKVAVVEVNRGMVDAPGTKEIPFVGHPAMFGRDRLHPSAQGDLIIAGNVAQQLGYAGRTAGLTRKPASQLPLQAEALAEKGEGATASKKGALSLGSGDAFTYKDTNGAASGATVEFRFGKKGYGDGAKGGWDDADALAVTLSTGNSSGTLHLSEGYISWAGGRVLYSADMSKMGAPIRVAWVAGAPAKGLNGGFYVWLGDMLIGEALSGATAEAGAGLHIAAGGKAVRFASLSYDPAASWAPSSTLYSAANPLIEASSAPPVSSSDDGSVVVRSAADLARLSAGSGVISGAKATATPRTIVFDGAPVSAQAIKLADVEEVHIINGSAVVLAELGGARKLVVDATSRLGLAPAVYEASVLNSGTIIIPQGTTLTLRPEGTDENETGTYVVKGGTLNANNVRMSNNIQQSRGTVSGISPDTFRGKLEKK